MKQFRMTNDEWRRAGIFVLPFVIRHSSFPIAQRTAGFQTCRIADFQIGRAWKCRAPWIGRRPAGLATRDTADLAVCGTPATGTAGFPTCCIADFQIGRAWTCRAVWICTRAASLATREPKLGLPPADLAVCGTPEACTAGFPTCCIADFQIGRAWTCRAPWIGRRPAGLATRDTADMAVCGTPTRVLYLNVEC
jgi:hypothetical protein